jgi:hypothetical protein
LGGSDEIEWVLEDGKIIVRKRGVGSG